MKVRLKRNLNTGQFRYKKTDPAGIEMPHITEIPTDDLPSDAEVLVGDKWEVNKPERAGAVERELIKPIPVNAGLVSRDELADRGKTFSAPKKDESKKADIKL